MGALEENIKDFVRGQGVDVVGVAGPERLDGPPSLDPTYTMRGARSIVCMATPMDVGAIYDFLSKRTPTPHNLDQLKGNQRMHRLCRNVADFVQSQGHRAAPVPPNNTYRRSPDVFSTHPSFSHRFGAIAAGIGAQGWSGNIMTEKYGAAVYLGTVVTEAVLESDPSLDPRHFIDGWCNKCKLCERACPSGMFDRDEEEQVLINGHLHPRGKRISIDFCNGSCFGLHGLSRDKKWSSWGRHWMREWMDDRPDGSQARKIRRQMLAKGGRTGDSTLRYDFIRRLGSLLWPEDLLASVPDAKDLPDDEAEQNRILADYARKIGIEGLQDYNVLTCGQCALICGPEVKESANRLRTLVESGIVVPGPDGRMVRCDTYEDAARIRRENPGRVTRDEMTADVKASFRLWHKYYFGVEPRSIVQGWLYRRKLEKAIKDAASVAPESR